MFQIVSCEIKKKNVKINKINIKIQSTFAVPAATGATSTMYMSPPDLNSSLPVSASNSYDVMPCDTRRFRSRNNSSSFE